MGQDDEDGDYDDEDDDIPALEEVNDPKKQPPVNGVKSAATNTTAATTNAAAPKAGGELAGFGNSLTVKGELRSPPRRLSPQTDVELIPAPSSSPSPTSCRFSEGHFDPGGILTVADDLLRNDGQKFLEMMEALADKRIRREKEAAESVLASFEDDGDDEDYDDEEEDEDEEDEVRPHHGEGRGSGS